MIKIRVLFSNTEDEIDTYFDQTVISFKQQLQKHYLFDDLNFHLIFSGKILDNAETLAKSGIKDGCKLRIYFRQKPKSYITIVGGGFKEYLTKIDGEMIVGELRTNIADKTGLQLEHLKLIFSGKVLVDEMTLNFYNITNGSLIYVASMKSDINRKVRPSMLLNQLYQLVSSLVSNPNQNRAVLMSEISELIENPVLQSYARIDRNAHKLIDEALRVLESVAATPVTNYEIIARLNDLALMQYEAYPEGINSLQETMISDNEDDDYTVINKSMSH
ncbi:hypothetical protein TRFO_30935 [Tritrichomonas foetus]|uniref:Ubiquitin-like domain-containing protein n=1 Tax=Tritrichomonas foetus TaxID=1144522 RepID=A0A1J4JTI6_9EUKA|nr:hypothetical protein TRFO_30935 [Tritrichomonas foetus]|eukprot:OHT02058.1 hypothetical protein TRFO_30935 [Tritrichomonas foetus]